MRTKTDTAVVVHLRTTTEAEQFHLQIYQALGMSTEILEPQKTIA